MKSMHKPVRECICCGKKFSKNQLLRIVKNQSGIYPDRSGKQPGRGAYICADPLCLARLIKQRRLDRAFRSRVDAHVYDAVIQALADKSVAKEQIKQQREQRGIGIPSSVAQNFGGVDE